MVLKPVQLIFIKTVGRNSESVTLVDEVSRANWHSATQKDANLRLEDVGRGWCEYAM